MTPLLPSLVSWRMTFAAAIDLEITWVGASFINHVISVSYNAVLIDDKALLRRIHEEIATIFAAVRSRSCHCHMENTWMEHAGG